MNNEDVITEYAASEMLRINQRLKEMVESENAMSDETREEIISDIETVLSRVRRAVSYLPVDENNKEEKHNEQ